MTLGNNVGRLMKHKEVSYEAVGAACGCPGQTIHLLVKRKSKKSQYAGALADYFGVPLASLVAAEPIPLDPAQRVEEPRAPYHLPKDALAFAEQLAELSPAARRQVIDRAQGYLEGVTDKGGRPRAPLAEPRAGAENERTTTARKRRKSARQSQ